MQFFETYRDQPKLAPLVRELSWTHNLLIMSRCKRDEEREFYLRLCLRENGGANGNWSASLPGPCSSELSSVAAKTRHRRCENCTPTPPTVFKDTYLVEFLTFRRVTPKPTCNRDWSNN